MKFEEYLASLQGRTVAVIGIGVSNRPLIDLLRSRGIAVTACDRKTREALGTVAEELEANGATVFYGKHSSKCPVCGGDWKQPEDSLFDYKCDKCKIVADKT